MFSGVSFICTHTHTYIQKTMYLMLKTNKHMRAYFCKSYSSINVFSIVSQWVYQRRHTFQCYIYWPKDYSAKTKRIGRKWDSVTVNEKKKNKKERKKFSRYIMYLCKGESVCYLNNYSLKGLSHMYSLICPTKKKKENKQRNREGGRERETASVLVLWIATLSYAYDLRKCIESVAKEGLHF